MRQPPGFVKNPNLVCKLLRSIYGLKQSGVIWHNLLKTTILENSSYTQSNYDPCLFFADNNNLILIYVDDILFMGENKLMKEKIRKRFTTHELGEINQFLNVEFNRTEDTIVIKQEKFVKQILSKYGFLNCTPKQVPLTKEENYSNISLQNNIKYIEIIGSLIYLATVSRPDIAFSVIYLSASKLKPKRTPLEPSQTPSTLSKRFLH